MLHVKNLSFSYNKTKILDGISFTVSLGEHISIIGESGSGKTTLLKLLYGEYDLNNGTIFWKKEAVLGPKFNLVVGYDFMKYVAQEFDLMPFISVEENIGKFLSNFFPKDKQKRTQELLQVVELSEFSKVKVKNLSGGQKQRVALARALAKQPEIVLLDEPFSHIDNFKKQSLRRRVFNYLKEKNITCIVATHDKNDVLGFTNKILFLNNKKIEVEGTPKQLYQDPKTPLIASFFGEFNTINNKIIYAHQLKVVKSSNLKVNVIKNYFSGSHYLVEAELDGTKIFFESQVQYQQNQTLYLEVTE